MADWQVVPDECRTRRTPRHYTQGGLGGAKETRNVVGSAHSASHANAWVAGNARRQAETAEHEVAMNGRGGVVQLTRAADMNSSISLRRETLIAWSCGMQDRDLDPVLISSL